MTSNRYLSKVPYFYNMALKIWKTPGLLLNKYLSKGSLLRTCISICFIIFFKYLSMKSSKIMQYRCRIQKVKIHFSYSNIELYLQKLGKRWPFSFVSKHIQHKKNKKYLCRCSDLQYLCQYYIFDIIWTVWYCWKSFQPY